jgi:hypothetical protein
VIDAKTSIEAHGQTQTTLSQLPYRQSYTHDAFGHVTSRASTLWSDTNWDFSYAFTNNRVVAGSTYDEDGRQTLGGDTGFEYDAPGGIAKTTDTTNYETTLARDGNGREAKRSQRTYDSGTATWGAWESRYFIYSSVLGQNLTEADTTGKKRRTYVIAGGATIARQGIDEGTTTEHVGWEHSDASGLSTRTTYANTSGGWEANTSAERDALGNDVGTFNLGGSYSQPRNNLSGRTPIPFNTIGEEEVEFDGMLMPASMAQSLQQNAYQLVVRYNGLEVPINQRNLPDGAYDPLRTLPGGGLLLEIPLHSEFSPDGARMLVPFGVNLNWGLAQTSGSSLSDIVKEAKTALSTRQSCRELFNSDIDPIDLLEKLEGGDSSVGKLTLEEIRDPRTGQIQNARGDAVPAFRYQTVEIEGRMITQNLGPTNVRVRLNSASFATRHGLSNLQDRALTLIHELGHAANFLRNKGVNPSPTASKIEPDNATDLASVSIANSEKVYDACFRPEFDPNYPGALIGPISAPLP